MQLDIQFKLDKDQKMKKYLYENSYWFKYLNRSSDNYPKFINAMKEKYKLKFSDKVTEAVDNINLVSSVLDVLNN